MKKNIKLILYLLLIFFNIPNVCIAKAKPIDLQKSYAEIKLLNIYLQDKNIIKILEILKNGEFPSQEEAAKISGNLGIEEALPILEKLDKSYSHFICQPSGVFGVAIVKIKNFKKSTEEKINALLKLAIKDNDPKKFAGCSSDAAKELGKIGDLSILSELKKINNYGAVEAVIRLETKDLSEEEKTTKYLQLIKEHKTPQLRTAGEVLLGEIGKKILPEILKLLRNSKVDSKKEKKALWKDYNYNISLSCLEIIEKINCDESIDAIVEQLNSPHNVIRSVAMNKFQRMIGKDFGFNNYKADKDRVIQEAQNWWKNNKKNYKNN